MSPISPVSEPSTAPIPTIPLSFASGSAGTATAKPPKKKTAASKPAKTPKGSPKKDPGKSKPARPARPSKAPAKATPKAEAAAAEPASAENAAASEPAETTGIGYRKDPLPFNVDAYVSAGTAGNDTADADEAPVTTRAESITHTPPPAPGRRTYDPLTELESEDLANFVRLISDPLRLRIIHLIAFRPGITVAEIVAELAKSQAAVSHHLMTLRHNGMARLSRTGKNTAYKLTPAGQALANMLAEAVHRMKNPVMSA